MLRATPMMLLLYAFLVNEFTDKASSRSISPCRAVNLKSEKPRKQFPFFRFCFDVVLLTKSQDKRQRM